MSRNTDASDRTRRIRSLVEFQGKVAGRNTNAYSQSSEVATGVDYGAIVSNVNGCCDTNYAAYFTVEENARAVASVFDISAQSAFTIEWWQTEAAVNAFLNRRVFSFGTNSENNVRFACFLEQGSILIDISNTIYPIAPVTIEYGTFESMLQQNHFAIVRDAGSGENIRIYKNGAFRGEFTYDGPIAIPEGSPTFTIRNESTPSHLAQMYGDLPSFRWSAASLYSGTDYNPVGNFTPPPMPLEKLPSNVITINTFPTTGSKQVDTFVITHNEAPSS